MSPLAKTLKLNGYNTAQFGKCHEVPVWQSSPVGPFDQWPTGGGGFEYFYGFIGGEAHQWYPSLYEGTTPIEAPKTPEEGYHLMEDMTDKAIGWIQQQKALAPDKPFFVYFAPGATHAPHHVPKEWADKYKGKFDAGWDKLREETFARQKKLGVIPADCRAHPAPQGRAGLGRHARSVQAGAAPADGGLRRLPGVHRPPRRAALRDDSKASASPTTRSIYYIIGDNGASAEGSFNGCYNEMSYFNGLQALETAEYLTEQARQARRAGVVQPLRRGLGARAEHPVPVDQAGRLALRRHAQRHHRALAQGHQGQGRAAHAVRARHRRGADHPRGGGHSRSRCRSTASRRTRSTASACCTRFNDAKAPEFHETQYFEVMGNRAIYHKGWTAVTKHYTPWIQAPRIPLDDDVWELYDTTTDWSQSKDLVEGDAGQAARNAAAVHHRGDALQGAAASTTGCSRRSTPTPPAARC